MVASSKRGMVSARNAFMENIGKITSEQGPDCSFLIANARIWEWPIVFASERFCATTGYHRAEIMNRSCIADFMKREHSNRRALQDFREMLESQATGKFEVKIYHKMTGNPMWFLIHVAPIRNDEEKTVFFHLIFKDITQLKTAIPGDKAGVSKLRMFVNKIAPAAQETKTSEAENRDGPESSNSKIADVRKSFKLNVETLPRYCFEKPVTPRGVIDHFSAFKTVWDWFILSMTFYTVIVVPYKEAFLEKSHNEWVYDSIMDVIFMLDVFLNFRTTFVGPRGDVVSDPSLIRAKYSRCWLYCDVISCIPYDIMLLFLPSSAMSTVLNNCKVVKLLRVGKFVRKSEHLIEYGHASLIMLLIWFAIFDHWMACLWYVIGWRELTSGNGTLPEQSWLVAMGRTVQSDYTLHPNGSITGGPSTRECYIASLYFTTTSLTSVGFGNISPNTKEARIYCIVIMLFGSFLFAAIFGNVASIIQRLYSDDKRRHDRLNEIRQFRKSNKIPNNLTERILDFDAWIWSKRKGVNIEEILNVLPKDLKADVCIHLNRKVFAAHPAFALASASCLRALATEFVITHAAPEDILFHKGEKVDAVYFVVSGSLEILQDGLIVAILHEGDAFGDALWDNENFGHSEYQVKTLTYCDLHSIKALALLRVLDFYPHFAKSFASKMELTYNIRKRVVRRTVSEVQQQRREEQQRMNDPSHSEIMECNQPVQTAAQKFKSRLAAEETNESFHEDGEIAESSFTVMHQSHFSMHCPREHQPRNHSEISQGATSSRIIEEDAEHFDQTTGNVNYSTAGPSHGKYANLAEDFQRAGSYFHVFKKDIRRQIQATNTRLERLDARLSEVAALLRARDNSS